MVVVIAFSADAAERAAALGERLEALGFTVEALPAPARLNAQARRDLAGRTARAHTVLALWSRGANAGLRETAQLAHRAGKLVTARLDSARPPLRADADLRADTPRAWSALRAALKPRAHQPRRDGASRAEGVFIALVFAAVALTASYLVNPPFAARVNAAAAAALAAASSACDCTVGTGPT